MWSISRLWGQRYDWVAQQPLGLDVITDGLFVLYGGLFGALGVRPSLLQGLLTVSAPAAELEGASFTFSYLGKDATVTVKNGSASVNY